MAETFIARPLLHIAPEDVRAFNAAVKRLPPWRSQMATAIAQDRLDHMAALVLGRDDSHWLPKVHLDLLGRAIFATLDPGEQDTIRKISRGIFGYAMRPQQ